MSDMSVLECEDDDEALTDPRELSDEEILEEANELRIAIADITRQLKDDRTEDFIRGDDWRRSATAARRYKYSRLEILLIEAETRNLGDGFPELRERIEARSARERQLEAIRVATEKKIAAGAANVEKQKAIAEAAAKAKAERIAATELRQKSQAEMFVQAARRLYSLDEYENIWSRAREMFPDDPSWAEIRR